MDLIQRRKQLRLRQIEKVKKFRDSNQSSSDARSDAIEKQKDREQMKKEIKKELSQESINIENSDGTTFARVMDIIGPTHMKPVVSGGLWKGTEQITEKKSDCECDDCGQDPCIECGESHHSVKEELVSERLGGKGYKSYTSLTGKKVSGDWEDSDRGAGNKAKRRAGGKVEKKSPTYQAHVLNKEAKEEQGRSDYGKASVRNKRKFGKEGEPAIFDASGERGKMIDSRRAEHKAKRGVKTKGVSEGVGAVAGGAAKVALGGAALAGKAAFKGAKFAGKAAAYLGKKAGNRIGKELVKATSDVDNNADKEFDKVKVKRYKETPVKEDYYSGTGEKVIARTKKWMDKKGQKGAPGLDAMKARAAEHKAKRGVKTEEVEPVDETYFDTNRRGISTKGGFSKQYNKPGKLSRASLNHERKSKNPELRMSKKELRKSMEDDANYEKKMGRSKPTPSNLKTALKKMKKEEVELDDQQQKQIDSKQKKADQIKKQVLLKKLQAVRAGGGSEIVASYSWRDDKNMRINKILNS